jgi:LmbE family N-acetylglucosaminyl deacetylase
VNHKIKIITEREINMTAPAQDKIEYIRLVGDERRLGPTLQSVSKHWQGDREKFLFISPHDDDVVLGAGLLMQLALKEGVPVYILIVTDGSMGYCTEQEKDTITKIREQETYDCYRSLGIADENIIRMNFPDCRLAAFMGRRPSDKDDVTVISGHDGLQNAFTHHIRKIRPTQCFLPTVNDLHPDHRIVHSEFLISLFHAGGEIWPELGQPIDKTPYVHEMGVYCDFPRPPKLRIRTPNQYLENKLNAIRQFKSQKQIASLVEGVRAGGAEEYYLALEYQLYNPARYRPMFDQAAASIPFFPR